MPYSIEVENIDMHRREILDLETSIYIFKPNNIDEDRLHTISYTYER